MIGQLQTESGFYHRDVAKEAGYSFGDLVFSRQYIDFLKANGLLANTRVFWHGGMGRVIDPNTPGDTISKAFSADLNRNNLVQATKANQLLRVGQVQGIAEGIYNPNGGSRFMTHPAISFGASDPWSLCIVLNFNGINGINAIPFGDTVAAKYVYVRVSSNNRVYVLCNGGYFFAVGITNQIIGKNTVIHLVADGSGGLTLYINGTAYSPTTPGTDTRFTFSRDNVQDYFGAHLARRIQSGALTASQVAAEAALLSAQWPDIPTTLIGTKNFSIVPLRAVCSANGTLVPEVQDTASWVAGTSAWCYNNGNTTPDTADMVKDVTFGKLYNGAARTVIAANPPSGYHVATESELAALSLLDANSLKATGTGQWTTANGTNTTGLYLLGGGNRKADGSFNLVGGLASYWCADSNRVLLVTDAGVASIDSADVKEGHSILLVKD